MNDIQKTETSTVSKPAKIETRRNVLAGSYKCVVIPMGSTTFGAAQSINPKDYSSVENMRKMFPSTEYFRDDDGCMMTIEEYPVYRYSNRLTGEDIFISTHKEKGKDVVEIERVKPGDEKNKVYAKYVDGQLKSVAKGPNSRTLCVFVE